MGKANPPWKYRNPEKPAWFRKFLVYNEGFGAVKGFPKSKEWWAPHFERESIDGVYHDIWRTPDNTVFRHENEIVREFFELGAYRAFPDVVTTEIKVREILDVDVVQGTYTVAFILQLRWYDKYFDQERFHRSRGKEVFCRSCPYVTVEGVVANDRAKNVPEEATYLTAEERHNDTVTLQKGQDPPGVLYKSLRIQATIRSQDSLEASAPPRVAVDCVVSG